MTSSTITLTPQIYTYFRKTMLREPDNMRGLREKTARYGRAANMQISPEQGQFMAFFVTAMGAKNIIEIGTFTGYSALWLASALPENGKLIACEIDDKSVLVGQPFWEKQGVMEKISVHIAPALDTLNTLLAQGGHGMFDFIFIDADKQSYDKYYECALMLLREGGVVAIDNTLWDGKTADTSISDASTLAIRALNAKLHGDERIALCGIPIGDGLTLARKRSSGGVT